MPYVAGLIKHIRDRIYELTYLETRGALADLARLPGCPRADAQAAGLQAQTPSRGASSSGRAARSAELPASTMTPFSITTAKSVWASTAR